MSQDVWVVPATVTRVVDGDTLMLHLSLGWHIYLDTRCRLIGVNAPEMSTDEGKDARAWVVEQLVMLGAQPDGSGIEVQLISHSLDKYGRPLGQIIHTSPQGGRWDLGSALLESGHAVAMGE